MSFINDLRSFGNKHGALIFTIVEIGTGIASLVMMYKAAPKAQRAIADAENDKWLKYTLEHQNDGVKYQPLTTMEKVKVAAPIVGPAIGMEVVSVAAGIGSYAKSASRIVQTTQALNSVITSKEIFEHAVEANVSRDKMEKIRKDVADQNIQQRINALPKDVKDDGLYSFVEPTSGQIFRATVEMLRQGCLDFNDLMMNKNEATLSDLMMCWINHGAKGLIMTDSTDGWFWKASHDKDWLKITSFSPISNDYGNPISYINYNRDPKQN